MFFKKSFTLLMATGTTPFFTVVSIIFAHDSKYQKCSNSRPRYFKGFTSNKSRRRILNSALYRLVSAYYYIDLIYILDKEHKCLLRLYFSSY